MAARTKTREITIVDEGGRFTTFFKRFTGETSEYDFEGISSLRKLLSNEKAKILHTIKSKSPRSLYHLSKLLQRDFKSVVDDVKLLEKFGFIDMIAEKTGKRDRLRPVVIVDSIYLHIKL
ncbi:ArsR family transcriptional regulator [Candidatus Pacearchaeota archaeon]|nr:ArsR family transcriptional regulator [Candidatus Pacearchaeota archaeon]